MTTGNLRGRVAKQMTELEPLAEHARRYSKHQRLAQIQRNREAMAQAEAMEVELHDEF